MAHADPEPTVTWLPNVKVLTQVFTNVLGFGVTWAVTKLGFHQDAATANAISAVVGVVAGFLAAYIVKEAGKLEAPHSGT